ncbi:MAG: ATP-binding cassette domain-containing protein [Bacteroidota bacterium]|nr:ATP-binding cassette domain-containing protein [Bacteroidota bacterium]
MSKSFAIHKMKGRTGSQDTIRVIRDVSIDIEKGSVTALIGANGAGKTTLFNLISGLLSAEEGRITFYNQEKEYELNSLKPYEIARLGIGRMFQSPKVFEKLSILDNLMLYLGNYHIEWPFYKTFIRKSLKREYEAYKEKILAHIAHYLGKDHAFYQDWNNPAGTLSFAEQRILSLLGLLLGDYKLILMDEPTAGINYAFLDELKHWITLLKDEAKTVFMIEHNMDFVRDSANLCHYMGYGKIMYSGSPEQVLGIAEVQKEYLI